MKISDGIIIPGESIDEYRIGSDEKEVMKYLNDNFVLKGTGDEIHTIQIDNAKFWFDSKGKLIQIGVTDGFTGKYNNEIGIGDTLADVQEKIGAVYEEYDDYLIEGVKGIAFELDDNDGEEEWVAMKVPIKWIYVYKCQ